MAEAINRILENNSLSVMLFAAAVLIVSILVLNWTFLPTMDAVEWREEIYRVQTGDTLWSISGDYCPAEVDRREWVDEIQALNGLKNSDIYPGQELIVLKPTK